MISRINATILIGAILKEVNFQFIIIKLKVRLMKTNELQ
jgi:hypothetical protein